MSDFPYDDPLGDTVCKCVLSCWSQSISHHQNPNNDYLTDLRSCQNKNVNASFKTKESACGLIDSMLPP